MTKREAIEILKSEQVVALGVINNITTTNAKQSFARLKHEALGVAISAMQEPERKHGEWVLDVGVSVESFICSQCGINTDMRYGLYKYCPNCGAIMDGKEKENEEL